MNDIVYHERNVLIIRFNFHLTESQLEFRWRCMKCAENLLPVRVEIRELEFTSESSLGFNCFIKHQDRWPYSGKRIVFSVHIPTLRRTHFMCFETTLRLHNWDQQSLTRWLQHDFGWGNEPLMSNRTWIVATHKTDSKHSPDCFVHTVINFHVVNSQRNKTKSTTTKKKSQWKFHLHKILRHTTLSQ